MEKLRIDEARGLACLLVVLFHAVGSEPILANSVIAYASDSLLFVRMPLFVTITGVLMGGRIVNSPVLPLLSKKMKRLGLPFLLLTIVCLAIDGLAGRSSNIFHALVYGSWHLWYLQVVGLFTLCYLPVAAVWKPTSNTILAVAFGAFALSASGLFAGIELLSLGRAVALAPFFVTGVWIGGKPPCLESHRVRWAIYGLGAGAAFAQQLGMNGYHPHWTSTSLVAGAVGVASAIAILRHVPRLPALATLGQYSFPVFLWHLPWFAVSSAVLLHGFHIDGELGMWLRVIVGLGMPVLMLETLRTWTPLPLDLVGDGGIRRTWPAARGLRHSDYGAAQIALDRSTVP